MQSCHRIYQKNVALSKLSKKDKQGNWLEEKQKDFEAVKRIVTKIYFLVLFRKKTKKIVTTDSSQT